jgi:hypothetical protein
MGFPCYMINSSGAAGVANPPSTNQIMATILEGQVELLMPALINAIESADAAAAEVKRLKQNMIKLIETPQTVRTTWGTVILKKPARTIQVIGERLKAQIKLLKEQGVADGQSEINFSAPALSVNLTDKKK